MGRPVTDLFPTSGGKVVSESHLNGRLHDFLDELGSRRDWTCISFRRSYATHLTTGEGFDLTFVQLQLGHDHAYTTSVYTLPSPDYQRLALERVHERTIKAALELPSERKHP